MLKNIVFNFHGNRHVGSYFFFGRKSIGRKSNKNFCFLLHILKQQRSFSSIKRNNTNKLEIFLDKFLMSGRYDILHFSHNAISFVIKKEKKIV